VNIRTHATRRTPRPPAAPGTSSVLRSAMDLLLIEDSPADVALFRHALNECALPCQLTVLTQRSDVEAFVRQAAPRPLSPLPG